MKSVVYARRLKTARGFLFVTCLYIIALLSIVAHTFPYQLVALYSFMVLTVFYLIVAAYWYAQAWRWKKFRERHPGIDNTELKALIRQAARRIEPRDVSTLADAFSEPPAQN